MNFCQNYFGKDLDQLTESDLVSFFSTPQKETQYIEFKSSGEPNVEQVFNKTLKPAVCSFLNSEGGILIYGAPREDRKNPQNPDNFKLRPYAPKFLGDHDSIIRKLADGITPMPIGVRLKEIEVEGGIVAVFEIQESQSKPHQTENIYQIRIDGQKKPAPHYLIEAMMKQITFPDIKIYLKINNAILINNRLVNIHISLFILNFSPFQNEKKVRYRMAISGNANFVDSNRPLTNNLVKHFDYIEHPIVCFGEPIHETKVVQAEINSLLDGEEIEIVMTMHGDSSPSKVICYQINGKGLKTTESLKERDRLKLTIDNMLFSEYQAYLGKTSEQALRDAIGIDI